MGFTGLYTQYYYYAWFIFVIRVRAGAFDYHNGREEVCGYRKQTNVDSICLTPSRAKAIVESLKIK